MNIKYRIILNSANETVGQILFLKECWTWMWIRGKDGIFDLAWKDPEEAIISFYQENNMNDKIKNFLFCIFDDQDKLLGTVLYSQEHQAWIWRTFRHEPLNSVDLLVSKQNKWDTPEEALLSFRKENLEK